MNQLYINFIANLFSLSLQQLLFRLKIYPEECFDKKTAVGLSLQSVKDSLLSEYITDLQKQIIKLMPFLEGIEIQIIENEQILLTYVITISYPKKISQQQNLESIQQSNITQFDMDIQLKSSIYSLIQQLNTLKMDLNQNERTFEVNLISNGQEYTNQNIQEMLLENYVLLKQSKKIRETKCFDSIHLPYLDLLIGLI